ncbi:MAG: fimbria/pilus periplasmic chaperone [Steroidobacteraceae bacterium]
MLRSYTLCLLASAMALGLSPAPAVAGAFSVTPVRVELSAKTQSGAVTLRNQQDVPVVVQAEVMLWEQADGEDRLAPTQELLVSPAVFTLPANGSQLVRVALQRPADATRELSYRLILTEVPGEAAPGFTGLNVTLRLSLPVFVEAQSASPARLEWSARADGPGRVAVTARNDGASHARVLSFTVTPAEGRGPTAAETTASYLLPGQARTWVLDYDKNDGIAAADGRRLRLKGMTEAGDFEVVVSPGGG